jgi:hypothetical protein
MPLTPEQVPTAVVIGKYGGGLPASSGSLIISRFNVAGTVIEVEVVEIANRGRSFPAEAFYPPRRYEDDDEVIWKPREDEEYEVIIRVNLGQRQIERHYFVKKQTQVVVTQIMNMLNTTKSRISIGVDGIKKATRKTGAILRNLRKRP